ncbi:MAG: histidinol-phosphatase, partial [Gemmatimonadetes bacterium]|nr:histidinol-phosphatase [Gemmatimonadota bacterium]
HVLGDWTFDDPRTSHLFDTLDLDAFYVEYLEAETAMARTGLYDILGHADLAKKFDSRASIDLTPYYRELLTAVMDAGMCYEVNTAGLRWPAGEIYPEPGFVRVAAEMGVPVTLGSDAHCPEDVGRDFDRALELVRVSGHRELAAFSGGEMRLVPLGDDGA